MSSNTRLKKGKWAVILLLLVLVVSINIFALFIYFAENNKKIQPNQSLKVLDNENPLEYISAVKSGNIPSLETGYLTYNSGGSSSSSNNNDNNGIGSPDDECQDFGFDFGVSKWDCDGAWSSDEEIYPGTSVTGSCDQAFWDIGTSGADGIIVKAGNIEHGGYYYSEQGITGTINLPKDISHITFCGYYGQPDCGNNITDQGEECDLGNNNGNQCVPSYNGSCTYCSSGCKNKTLTRFCGDAHLDTEEECDDGNKINGDGCDSNCKIEKECCDDEDCHDDLYSHKYCYNIDVWINFTDYFCKDGKCLFNITKIFVQDCGNESYSVPYCYNNNVYQNHSTPGCENGGCILRTDPEKTQDCGTDSCSSWTDYVCEGKNKTRTRTCYDKGCEQSACFNNSNIEKQSEKCAYDCVNGECTQPKCGDGHLDLGEECDDGNLINRDGCDEFCKIEINCFNNSDCGTDEWLNQDYCVCTTNVWDFWKIYECKNPGTSQSYCTNRTEKRLKQECGQDSCTDYQNYCENNDVWKKRTCQDVGCVLGVCFNNTILNTTLVQDCGADSCGDWSDYVCEGKNRTRTRTCYDKGCKIESCFNTPRNETESEECDYDCVNGTCIHPVCGNNILELGEECDDGNLFNNDGCDENCTLEICEHDVGIRYSYRNSFGTGIAIKLNGTNDWLEDPVELTQDQNYIIKYIIDNKIQNTTNNIHVIVSINAGNIVGYRKVPGCEEGRGRGGGRGGCEPSDIPIYGNITILADYNTLIHIEHSKSINLNISNLSPGTYNISVYVEKINEIDCNLSDNYAEREITVKAECCEDKDCPNDSYSNDYCKDNNVYRNFTDYFCKDGKCLFNITKIFVQDCGNESYSNEYCYNNDVYQNHSIPGCENNACTLSNEINKTQECGEDSYGEIKYCYTDDVWINKSQELRGCEQGECFYSSELTSELFKDCGNETYSAPYCYNNNVYQNHSTPGCENNGCILRTDPEKTQDCGTDSCSSWTDYVCEGKNRTRTRTCYDKGCEQANCFSTPRQEKQAEVCAHDCVDGECTLPRCGDSHLDLGEECDDGNLINGDGCDEFCKIEECCDDEDCPDDISNNYCYYNDVWKNLTDYFCQNGKCLFNISSIFFQDCGETSYGEWDYYCIGKEIWKNKTDIFRGCSNAECFENKDYKNEYVDYCEQRCVDGECKGECEIDSDCPKDYYDSSYCGGDSCPESVYKDFHDFSCTPRKKCVEKITPILIEECDFTCLDNRCVNSDCDGVDLSNCKEWVDCVCVASKK